MQIKLTQDEVDYLVGELEFNSIHKQAMLDRLHAGDGIQGVMMGMIEKNLETGLCLLEKLGETDIRERLKRKREELKTLGHWN